MMEKGKAVLARASAANLKKTYYYLKKNGLSAALFAVRERLGRTPYADYHYELPKESVLDAQRRESGSFSKPVTISLLVPAYNTNPAYLRALLDSVHSQTYPHWELILADASTEPVVEEIVQNYRKEKQETRIRYLKLEKNEGISGNSNCALKAATGEYIGLLDHDDLLTPDALYENAIRILKGRQSDAKPQLLYSDEDKCDESGENYYEVYRKKEFNLDLLLSNNYICHFLVMRTDLMQKLQFRCNFDGSQDYDLILRGVAEILPEERKICHIPKVLYHWRCHSGSTAENPQSKQYAYEAGKAALEDFLRCQGFKGSVSHTRHLGFFRITYEPDVFIARPDVGILGGRLINRRNKVAGGIYEADGSCPYQGLPAVFSGYMHQAVLQQDAEVVDIRCMRIRKELWALFSKITGVMYREEPVTGLFDSSLLPADTDWIGLSRRFCQVVREQQYRILWDPKLERTKIK